MLDEEEQKELEKELKDFYKEKDEKDKVEVEQMINEFRKLMDTSNELAQLSVNLLKRLDNFLKENIRNE